DLVVRDVGCATCVGMNPIEGACPISPGIDARHPRPAFVRSSFVHPVPCETGRADNPSGRTDTVAAHAASLTWNTTPSSLAAYASTCVRYRAKPRTVRSVVEPTRIRSPLGV